MDSRWTGAGAAVTASPPPRRRNPDHPPYAEMVRAALLAKAENGGSTEAVISSYIVSAYPGIPPGHPRLLPYYLRKLVTARELSVSPSGRYLLPDSCPCESSAPPPSPKLNALPSPSPSFVLRLRKSISDEDGNGLKVGWCYVGDGSTSSPSVTDQQSGTVTKKPSGESYPPIPDSIQAEPEKALLPPSPSSVWDTNMEGMSLILGLDEHKESLTGPSPINEQQLGSESRTGPEKAPLPPSPSLVSDPNLESITLTLGLAFMSPTNKQLSESESRKHDGESGCEAKKRGGESYLLVPDSIHAEPKKALVPSSPVSGPNMEGISQTLGPDDPNESMSPFPVSVPNMEVISPTLVLNDSKELLVVPSPVDEQQLGSEDGVSHPPIPVSMQIVPGEALLPPSPSPLWDSFRKCTSLDKPKESSLAPIANQQSGSESEKQHGDSNLLTPVTMQVETEREPLLPNKPIADPNMEWTSPILGLDELKESWPAAPCITDQQSESEPAKQDRESLLVALVSMQTQLQKEQLSPPLPSLVLEPSIKRISLTLGLDEPKESPVVLSPITEQQLGSENGESHPPVPASMQTESEEALLPPPPLSDPNLEFASPILVLDKPKESSPILAFIAEQQSGNESTKQEEKSHPPTTVSIYADVENVSPLSPQPVSDSNMEWTSQVLGLDELKKSSSVSHTSTEQQSGSDPRKQDGESHSSAPDSVQADSKEVLSLPPAPPMSGRLQTKPDPRMPSPLNPETNGGWSSLALTLDELKEPLAVPTPFANKQSGTGSNKEDMDSHPPNLTLMQTATGKKPSPPLISMQLQAELEPKLSSPDYVPEKPSLALGEKKSLSGKPRPKRRKLWYE